MDFKILTPREAYPLYRYLHREAKQQYLSFNGFDWFYNKLYRGDFLLLKNRFHLKVYAGMKNGLPKILMTHYQPKNALSKDEPHSLGAILLAQNIDPNDFSSFLKTLAQQLGWVRAPILAPMNGHVHLGMTIPSEKTRADQITFLTAAKNENLSQFFSQTPFFEMDRKFHSLLHEVKDAKAELLQLEEYAKKRPLPPEYKVRKFSLLHAKRDVRIYHELLNQCFKEHYRYDPLSFDEEWELMKMAIPLIRPDYFRFLMFNGKEVAVCWFLSDYNRVFQNTDNLRNFTRIPRALWRPYRVRGVYGAILPEHRGKSQMKWLRNEIYRQILKDGVKEVESSYIDEGNENSLAYVKSTGGKPSHEFFLYRFNGHD